MPNELTPRAAAARRRLTRSNPCKASISSILVCVTAATLSQRTPPPGPRIPVYPPSYHREVAFERTVAHLDMDAFYASVELRRRPELRGKPVVVCGSGPRAVVTTASYEARKLAGIHSAMPAAIARRRLPDAVYIQPDFTAYREASGEVMAVLHRNAETVEVVGLDEAYVDLTGIFSPKATMRRIAAEIKQETGLTCSIGISESRMLAKITSELGKPAGLVVLSRAEALARFAESSPGLIPGVGPKTVTRLEAMGIRTLADLRSLAPQTLEQSFGPRQGRWLHRRARLEDDTPVTVVHETKSQSAETTFDVDVHDRGELEGHLGRLSGELCRRLRKRDLQGRTIGIKVRLDDWTNVTRSQTVEEPTNDATLVGSVALDLLRAYDPPRPVRLLGVRVAGFDRGEAVAVEPVDEEDQLRLALTD
jgi:DNA polymerase IV